MASRLFIIVIFFLHFTNVSSQEAGATFYAGLSNGFFPTKSFCNDCKYHSSRFLSMDGRLNSGGMYFLFTVDYQKSDHFPTSKIDYFGDNQLTMVKGKGGLGFRILKISKKIFFTSKAQVAFDLIVDHDKNLVENKGYKMNDGFMGLITGIAFNFGALVLDLEYEKGIVNVFYEQPDTKLDFVSLKAGIAF
jgi:hypothetical protein